MRKIKQSNIQNLSAAKIKLVEKSLNDRYTFENGLTRYRKEKPQRPEDSGFVNREQTYKGEDKPTAVATYEQYSKGQKSETGQGSSGVFKTNAYESYGLKETKDGERYAHLRGKMPAGGMSPLRSRSKVV